MSHYRLEFDLVIASPVRFQIYICSYELSMTCHDINLILMLIDCNCVYYKSLVHGLTVFVILDHD